MLFQVVLQLGIQVHTWDAFLRLWSIGAHGDIDYDLMMRRPEAEDLCTIMYTSGTTGVNTQPTPIHTVISR